MNTSKRYVPEISQQALRMVIDKEADYSSQWVAISAIAPKISCTTQTLRRGKRHAGRIKNRLESPTTSERKRIKALESENQELRQTKRLWGKGVSVFCPCEGLWAGNLARKIW